MSSVACIRSRLAPREGQPQQRSHARCNAELRPNLCVGFDAPGANSCAAEAKARRRVTRNHKITRITGNAIANPIHAGKTNGTGSGSRAFMDAVIVSIIC